MGRAGSCTVGHGGGQKGQGKRAAATGTAVQMFRCTSDSSPAHRPLSPTVHLAFPLKFVPPYPSAFSTLAHPQQPREHARLRLLTWALRSRGYQVPMRGWARGGQWALGDATYILLYLCIFSQAPTSTASRCRSARVGLTWRRCRCTRRAWLAPMSLRQRFPRRGGAPWSGWTAARQRGPAVR